MSTNRKGQRHVVPLVTLQLASDHLVEEPPVVASGERVGDRLPVQLGPGFLQTTVGDPQLVCHFLEHQQMHSQGGEQEEQTVDDHQLGGEDSGGAARQRDTDPHLCHRSEQQRDADDTGAEELRLFQHSQKGEAPRHEQRARQDILRQQGHLRTEQERRGDTPAQESAPARGDTGGPATGGS